ncbi:hypothetical protein GCWU000341_02577 [Oribacterium sp. oral taxon 078 str. F0262]|nr:hypothetical protein GCWU000341_02577 [Oribacterium sp. oral taxon 078 str. F0262]
MPLPFPKEEKEAAERKGRGERKEDWKKSAELCYDSGVEALSSAAGSDIPSKRPAAEKNREDSEQNFL